MTGVANWLASSLIYGRSSFWPMTTNHCRPIVAIRPLSVSLSLSLSVSPSRPGPPSHLRLDWSQPSLSLTFEPRRRFSFAVDSSTATCSWSRSSFSIFFLTAILRVWRRRLGTGHRPNVTVGAGLSFVESLLINMHHLLLLLLLLLMLLASHAYLVFPFH